MSIPPESPEEVTQRIPPVPPGPSDTAPLWRSEIGRLDSLMGSPPAPPAPSRPRPSTARRGWLLKGAGLLVVAVLAGLVWVVVSPSDSPKSTPAASTSTPSGAFVFTPSPQAPLPLKDSTCVPHAYGQTKEFLTTTPCKQLARQLFTTVLEGRTVYTSVSVVRMASEADAAKLKDLTTRDGTGNVNDLVKDGAVAVPGLKTLAAGGFAATLKDRDVIIVESDSVERGTDATAHNAEMKRISIDAFRLAADITN
ncbi:hypothetical protein [Actinosynnema sp. NPDC020468]|uniref:hypothetical protein n=1 Tax=Actinosynnema sp. NPDC020468 TaxID=3154488 RepID=UPI0033E1BC5A